MNFRTAALTMAALAALSDDVVARRERKTRSERTHTHQASRRRRRSRKARLAARRHNRQ